MQYQTARWTGSKFNNWPHLQFVDVISCSWSSLDKGESLACHITSPFNKKMGCFCTAIFLTLFKKQPSLLLNGEASDSSLSKELHALFVWSIQSYFGLGGLSTYLSFSLFFLPFFDTFQLLHRFFRKLTFEKLLIGSCCKCIKSQVLSIKYQGLRQKTGQTWHFVNNEARAGTSCGIVVTC